VAGQPAGLPEWTRRGEVDGGEERATDESEARVTARRFIRRRHGGFGQPRAAGHRQRALRQPGSRGKRTFGGISPGEVDVALPPQRARLRDPMAPGRRPAPAGSRAPPPGWRGLRVARRAGFGRRLAEPASVGDAASGTREQVRRPRGAARVFPRGEATAPAGEGIIASRWNLGGWHPTPLRRRVGGGCEERPRGPVGPTARAAATGKGRGGHGGTGQRPAAPEQPRRHHVGHDAPCPSSRGTRLPAGQTPGSPGEPPT